MSSLGCWWSYYDPDWGSVGLWDTAALTVTDVVALTADHPAVLAAAAAIVRVIDQPGARRG